MARLLILALSFTRDDAGFGEFMETPPILSAIRGRVYLIIYKCNMCIDRVQHGMLPACVKTCPTDTMHFGDRDEIMALALTRLKEVQQRTPTALLADSDMVRVLFLCEMPPKYYHGYMVAESGEVKPVGNTLYAGLSRRELLGLRDSK